MNTNAVMQDEYLVFKISPIIIYEKVSAYYIVMGRKIFKGKDCVRNYLNNQKRGRINIRKFFLKKYTTRNVCDILKKWYFTF